jgi:hypothetical protein
MVHWRSVTQRIRRIKSRHTAEVVTAEQAKGVPMSLVAQVIGHRDPSTTKAFY